MIIPTLRIITVDVISFIAWVNWIKCFHAHTTCFNQDGFNIMQTLSCMIRLKQIRSVCHSYAYIWSQLIFSMMSCTYLHQVFVYSSSLYQSVIDCMLIVKRWISGNPEITLKVTFDHISPMLISPNFSIRKLNTISLYCSYLVHVSHKP